MGKTELDTNADLNNDTDEANDTDTSELFRYRI